MPASPVTSPSDSAAALGGPVEAGFDLNSFFGPGANGPKLDTGLLGRNDAQPAANVTNTSVQIPDANGTAPTVKQTRSTTVTDPGSGVSFSATTTNTGSGFNPTSVEAALPLARDGNVSVNGLVGVRTDSWASGAGVQYKSGDVKADVQFRAITPVDTATPAFTEVRADVSAGTSPKVSAGITVTDKPGSAADSTEVRASVTAPINNSVSTTVFGSYVSRPGEGDDGVGAGLRIDTRDGFGEVRLDQNSTPAGSGETVVQVRVGVSF
jgi:hypothetical protein